MWPVGCQQSADGIAIVHVVAVPGGLTGFMVDDEPPCGVLLDEVADVSA